MRISGWSSDVCSSDLPQPDTEFGGDIPHRLEGSFTGVLDDQVVDRLQIDIPRLLDVDHAGSHSGDEPVAAAIAPDQQVTLENGRASSRERGCQYEKLSASCEVLENK